jgi:hypothetical protein
MLAVAWAVYFALDRGDFEWREPGPKPKAFVPPPTAKKTNTELPTPPEMPPIKPLPPVFPFHK